MPGRALAVMAAVLGLAGVVLAAMGAHLLSPQLPDSQRVWNTALQMHLFHAAVLLAVAAFAGLRRSKAISFSGWLMVAGVLLFSGTLYLKAVGIEVLPGPVTPFGGLVLMLAWCTLIVTMIRKIQI